MSAIETRKLLTDKGLKVTPQRLAVLESFQRLEQHPTTDKIIGFIRKNHPNIATGTVYKTLETFVEKGLLKRVKTDRDVMRYDPILEPHHHMYCEETGKIEDYFDDELNDLIKNHFENRTIPGFEIKEVILQIKGDFTND
jgi:Fur family peroxide stress response transcriptional regulator